MHIPEYYSGSTEMHGSTADRSRGGQSISVLTSKTATCSIPVRFVTRYPVDASVGTWDKVYPVIQLSSSGSEEEARARFCISVRELSSEMISRVDSRGGLHAIETRTALGGEMELGDTCMRCTYTLHVVLGVPMGGGAGIW